MTVAARDDDHGYWLAITTRWMDNDMYGHVNNVQYYSFFDTVVTQWLVERGGLEPGAGAIIGLCVESQCAFHAPLSFPEQVTAGLRVGHLGTSSVRYEVVLYGEHGDQPAATGHFVHVYVDRETRRPAQIPGRMRDGLEALLTAAGGVPAGRRAEATPT